MKNRDHSGDEPGSLARKKRKKHRPLSFSAMETGDLAMLRMLAAKNPDLGHERDLDGMTLIRKAAFHGREDVVAQLRETAGPLDAFEAAVLGETVRLAELLDAGEASPDDESPEGYGLLHLCAFFGRAETAVLLLDRGGDVHATQAGAWALLHHAAQKGEAAFAEALLERGADPAVHNERGQTPADIAHALGHAALAERLGYEG